MIRFTCARCSHLLEAKSEHAGGKLACPKCGQRLQVPTPTKPAATNKTILGYLTQDASVTTNMGTAPVVPPTVDPRELKPWYVRKGNSSIGPFAFSALRTEASSGRIGPDDLVWTPGMGKWIPASNVQGVFLLRPSRIENLRRLASMIRSGHSRKHLVFAVGAIALSTVFIWLATIPYRSAKAPETTKNGDEAAHRLKESEQAARANAAMVAKLQAEIVELKEAAVNVDRLRAALKSAEELASKDRAFAEDLVGQIQKAEARAALERQSVDMLGKEIEARKKDAEVDKQAVEALQGKLTQAQDRAAKEVDAAKKLHADLAKANSEQRKRESDLDSLKRALEQANLRSNREIERLKKEIAQSEADSAAKLNKAQLALQRDLEEARKKWASEIAMLKSKIRDTPGASGKSDGTRPFDEAIKDNADSEKRPGNSAEEKPKDDRSTDLKKSGLKFPPTENATEGSDVAAEIVNSLIGQANSSYAEHGFAGYKFGTPKAEIALKPEDHTNHPWRETTNGSLVYFSEDKVVGISKGYPENPEAAANRLKETFGQRNSAATVLLKSRNALRVVAGSERYTREYLIVHFSTPSAIIVAVIIPGVDALRRPILIVSAIERKFAERILVHDLVQKWRILNRCEPLVSCLQEDRLPGNGDRAIKSFDMPALWGKSEGGSRCILMTGKESGHAFEHYRTRGITSYDLDFINNPDLVSSAKFAIFLTERKGKTSTLVIHFGSFPDYTPDPFFVEVLLKPGQNPYPAPSYWNLDHLRRLATARLLFRRFPPIADRIDITFGLNSFFANEFNAFHTETTAVYSWRPAPDLIVQSMGDNTLIFDRAPVEATKKLD